MAVIPVWMFFLVGQGIHAWLRASVVVKSTLNGVGTYQKYIQIHAPVIVIRFFFATLGLMAWSWKPDAFSIIAAYFHWDVAMSVPLNPISAGVYGYFADSVIDLVSAKFPALQREIPPVGISEQKTVDTPSSKD